MPKDSLTLFESLKQVRLQQQQEGKLPSAPKTEKKKKGKREEEDFTITCPDCGAVISLASAFADESVRTAVTTALKEARKREEDGDEEDDEDDPDVTVSVKTDDDDEDDTEDEACKGGKKGKMKKEKQEAQQVSPAQKQALLQMLKRTDYAEGKTANGYTRNEMLEMASMLMPPEKYEAAKSTMTNEQLSNYLSESWGIKGRE